MSFTQTLNKIQCLSRNQLKYIAMFAMSVRHTTSLFENSNYPLSYIMMDIVNPIFHFAVPIFMVFMIDGMARTKHFKQNMLLLIIFGIITEPLFDLYFNDTIFSMAHENILWTYLAYGLFYLACTASQTWIKSSKYNRQYKIIRYIFLVLLATIMLIVAEIVNIDYAALGLFGMMLGYLIYKKTHYLPAVMGIIIFLQIAEILYLYQFSIYSILMCSALLVSEVLMFLYNPDKPCDHTKLQKYGGYAFYPSHLAILTAIKAIFLH